MDLSPTICPGHVNHIDQQHHRIMHELVLNETQNAHRNEIKYKLNKTHNKTNGKTIQISKYFAHKLMMKNLYNIYSNNIHKKKETA